MANFRCVWRVFMTIQEVLGALYPIFIMHMQYLRLMMTIIGCLIENLIKVDERINKYSK